MKNKKDQNIKSKFNKKVNKLNKRQGKDRSSEHIDHLLSVGECNDSRRYTVTSVVCHDVRFVVLQHNTK